MEKINEGGMDVLDTFMQQRYTGRRRMIPLEEKFLIWFSCK